MSVFFLTGIVGLVLFADVYREDRMPFRGLLSDPIVRVMGNEDWRRIFVAWMPSWWIMMASSSFMVGIGFACSLWAFVEYEAGNRDMVGSPLLLGVSAIIGALGTILIPIATLIFKDRSESRNLENMKSKIVELEKNLSVARYEYGVNRTNIQTLADLTQKVVNVIPDVNFVVNDEMGRSERQNKNSDKS